mgnify:CR=1 FL=1
MSLPALPLAKAAFLAAGLALAGCAGPVAPDAPALLSAEELAARAAVAQTGTEGASAAATLQGRAARLRARAAALRQARLPQTESSSLLRRAEDLRQG